MSEVLFSLSLSLAILGCVVYGITAVLKPLLPTQWRTKTGLGKSAMLAIPVALGGLLGIFAMPALVKLVSDLTGAPEDMMADVSMHAAFIMGLFAGTFATQLHNAIRTRIGMKAKQE
jgi:hypothetical protein